MYILPLVEFPGMLFYTNICTTKEFSSWINLLKFTVTKILPRTLKSGLEIQGQNRGYLRSPLQSLSESDLAELEQILKAFRFDLI
ncbi:hypothetical protein [Flavobacterium sp.]|uniref:hypothetical protein n=1 Tax=Flavobacterium sp. TaxID=239 RepID=UPI0032672607